VRGRGVGVTSTLFSTAFSKNATKLSDVGLERVKVIPPNCIALP